MELPTIQTLTKNGFEYYKSQDHWTPLDAALIVCRFSPSIGIYDNIPEKAKEIYEKSVADYKNGKIGFYKKEKIFGKSYIEFCRKYFCDFCIEKPQECEECEDDGDCDEYECLFLICFHPCTYVKWIMDSKLMEVPEELIIDHNKRDDWYWRSKFDWDSKEPNSVETDKSVKLVPFLENQSEKLDQEFQSILEKMKKYDYWTLKESIALLKSPILFDLISETEILENGDDLQPYIRAIKAGTLRVLDFDIKEAKAKDWDIKFTDLEIYPFEFLEFVKEKGLFDIPSELKYIKKKSDSEDTQYAWASDINGGANPVAEGGQCLEDDSQKTIGQNTDSVVKGLQSLLPCAPGTQWEHITITLTSKDQVKIKTLSGEKLCNYAEIGMQDERNTEKKKRIWALLMLFASNQGILDSEAIENNKKIFESPGKQELYDKFMTVTKELNKHLKDLFGINDSIYIGPHNKMYKNKNNLKKYRPKLFEGEDTYTEIQKIEQKKLIDGLLKKKGYATKIKFVSKLHYSPDPVEEKSLHEQALDDTNRLMNQR